ncbi:DUF1045 domain-containing protein [Roseiterribacter gracilis]|uniref:Phosphonate metabolism protein n=1 Tax=Roseiterribacter gracilis TaxID=2812848 RepID=A0A8S8X874_9PROT|nr:phosphonate metabolism protein [Rhodospirillales bacterium TMPK1]
MRTDSRFAIYVVPHADSPLGRIGHGLLAADEAPSLGLDASWYAARSVDARRYGFHATLKSPFRLQGDYDALEAAIAALAARHAPIRDVQLSLSELHGFLALRPAAPSLALDALAAACVRDLDRFRRPADAAELEKRRAAGLTARQEENLQRYGYPYVLDDFRFHLTLSDRLPDDERALLKGRLTSAFDACRLDVVDLALCIEEAPGAQLMLVRRFVLGLDHAQ